MREPRQFGNDTVMVDGALAARVRRFIVTVGTKKAAVSRLGMSDSTIDAAREGGRIQRVTRDRLIDALNREEARRA